MLALGATGADHFGLGGSGARSLRHHTPWLLAGGADLKGVMERMGHTQFQTTQKYQHPLPDTDQKNLDAFSRVADRRIQVIPAPLCRQEATGWA
jgi:integrase